jgi:hypothetical protein
MPIGEEVKPGVFVIGGYNGTGNIMGALYARKAIEWTEKSLSLEKL